MFKPMLAGKAPSFDKIKYPVLATPKLDGIRCVVVGDRALSRSLKPIPNQCIRETIEKNAVYLNRYDGEIILPGRPFNEISSAVMSFDGCPNFEYWVFDFIDTVDRMEYQERVKFLNRSLPSFCKPIIPAYISNRDQLEEYEARMLTEGYEGVIIRDPHGPYKCGRSTEKEGWMLKIKRFEDGEARIVGFEELEHNTNQAFIGELGQTKRTTHQAFQVPGGVLGALIVEDVKTGIRFNIGSGFTQAQREEIWRNRSEYLDKLAKYKCQPHGRVEKPRSPIFLGIRSIFDL